MCVAQLAALGTKFLKNSSPGRASSSGCGRTSSLFAPNHVPDHRHFHELPEDACDRFCQCRAGRLVEIFVGASACVDARRHARRQPHPRISTEIRQVPPPISYPKAEQQSDTNGDHGRPTKPSALAKTTPRFCAMSRDDGEKDQQVPPVLPGQQHELRREGRTHRDHQPD